jgi:hypothetical protein
MNISRPMHDELDDGWDVDEQDRVAAHRVSLLRVYFTKLGLWDEPTSEAAARCVVTAVLREPYQRDDAALERRLVTVARKWVRDFSEPSASPPSNWFSRAPVLLSKFPSAFLVTPLPGQV